jgi:hypothetical protein
MNRFAKIMQLLGWAGAALLAVVWTHGTFVRGDTPELGRHSMIALAAACLCVLPRCWTIAYLLLAARGRAGLATGAPGAVIAARPSPTSAHAVRLRRQALAAALFALVGLSVSFSLGGAILLRRVEPVAHAIAGAIAIVLHLVALFFERRALLADGSQMMETMERMKMGERAASGAAEADRPGAGGKPASGLA